MTLNSATTLDGTTLASSTYSFVIDSGQSNQEFVIADCTGTTCTNMQRGLSAITGTTTVAQNQYSHRKLASVDIVDAPLIIKLTNMANGLDKYPAILSYIAGIGCNAGSPTSAICDNGYIKSLVNQGAATSTETLGGIVRLATKAQQAATYYGGANDPAVLYSRYSSSTPSTPQSVSANTTIISGATGYLTQTWLDLTAWWHYSQLFADQASSTNATTTNLTVTGNAIFSGTIAGVAGTASTSQWAANATWNKPSGAKVVTIQVWGGGGGGGGADTDTSGAGGGGGGAFNTITMQASALPSSVSITIGAAGGAGAAGGNGGDGGQTCFSSSATCGGTIYITAFGGKGGQADCGGSTTCAGSGGGGGGPLGGAAATDSTFGGGGGGTTGANSVYGGGGGGGNTNGITSGAGGNSVWGGGGGGGGAGGSASAGGTSFYGGAGGTGGNNNVGNAGSVPGGGGGGAGRTSTTNRIGGAGAAGQVIVITYF